MLADELKIQSIGAVMDIITVALSIYVVVSLLVLAYDAFNVYNAMMYRKNATLNRVHLKRFAYLPRLTLFGRIILFKEYAVYEHVDGKKKFRVII